MATVHILVVVVMAAILVFLLVRVSRVLMALFSSALTAVKLTLSVLGTLIPSVNGLKRGLLMLWWPFPGLVGSAAFREVTILLGVSRR